MTTRPRRERNLARFLPCAVPVVLLAILGWNRRWTADDGFINLRVVQQVLHGNGPVFNAGERVEATTSALWIFLLSVTKLVFGFVALEWIAVALGLTFAVAGLALAELGAYRLLPREREGTVLPFGALVIALLPPFWDYATSGLETGLTFTWLGGSFLALATLATRGTTASDNESPAPPAKARRLPGWAWAALLLGLGPIVRPDLAIITATFLVALLIIEWHGGIKRRVTIVALCAVIPVISEIIRIGYYATLVPNTAIAKSASAAQWERGWHYLANLVGTYWLWIPLLVSAALLARALRDCSRQREWGRLAVVAAPVAGGLLSAFYVVRLGGDFMHARFLLPSLFALMLPLAVIRVVSWRSSLAVAAGVIGLWAVVCGLSLRPTGLDQVSRAPDGTEIHTYSDSYGVGDERSVAMAATKSRHPVTLSDWAKSGDATSGRRLRRLARSKPRVLISDDAVFFPAFRYPLADPIAPTVAKPAGAIGVIAFAAGPDVFIVDLFGLANPIGSRFPGRQVDRPGHQKFMRSGWVIGRFADPSVRVTKGATRAEVEAARAAMSCGQLRRLIEGVTAPLSIRQVLRNMRDSVANTTLRYSGDPGQAARELCG